MPNGYNTNGRPKITISASGRGHNWREIRLTLDTPEGVLRDLTVSDAVGRLGLYDTPPVLQYHGKLPAPLKAHLRRHVSGAYSEEQ